MPKLKQAACWDKLEQFYGEEYPECMKQFLEYAAYDRLNSLKAIDRERLKDIEKYIVENRPSWIDSLSCCKSEEYKKQASFYFLPGHKTIVLGIPEQIKQMSGVKEVAFVKKKKEHTDDELMVKLISNVMKNMKKNECPLPNNLIGPDISIRDFTRGSSVNDFVCKCRFVCPFCPKIFPVTFKKFWMTSNLTKHMKSHVDFCDVECITEENDINDSPETEETV